MAPRSVARAAVGMLQPRKVLLGAQASRYGVASSFGRHCFALYSRTIRVVAFPFKDPISQSRRRASGDLFGGSLSLLHLL
jgi:hypothetical protein